MEETISLQDIFKTIKKRASLIVAITIVAVMISAIISFFLLTPIYQASTQILVNQKKEDTTQQVTTADIQSNLQLINTYNEIIRSPAILSIVIEDLKLNMSPAQLASKISVSNANNSQVLNVAVQDENHSVAVEMANQIVEVFKVEILSLMSVDNVNVLSPAQYNENPSPIKPNKMLNIAIALVLGIMVGVGLAFLLEYLDTKIRTERDVEELLELPILGVVSPIIDKDLKKGDEILSRRRGPVGTSKRKAGV